MSRGYLRSIRDAARAFTSSTTREPDHAALKVAVLLGPPGSGKGTLCTRLARDRDDVAVVSTGDLLRRMLAQQGKAEADADAEASASASVAAAVQQRMSRGELVSDSLVARLVRERVTALRRDSRKRLLALDGFPRTAAQAQELSSQIPVHLVVVLAVPSDAILARFRARWIHAASGRTYSDDYAPPRRAGFDDITGEALERRADDAAGAEVAMRRVAEFYNTTLPELTAYYSASGAGTVRDARNSIPIHTLHGRTSDELFPKLARLLGTK